MNVIILLLIIDTVVQLLVCKISLWWLIALTCRILFSCRILGATFKVKNIAIGEGVAFASMLLFNMLFTGEGGFPWLKIILFLLFSTLSVFLMFLDDFLYMYVIIDDDD